MPSVFAELRRPTRAGGARTEHTIRRHLMSCVVNLPPARYEWANTRPFLLLHEDGTYQLYNPRVHPRVRE